MEQQGGDAEVSHRRDVRLDVLAATAASTAMIAQQVAGKATRDALFLTQFDVRRLPGMMIVSALISFAAALVAGWALNKYGPRRAVRIAFLLGATAFALEFAASWFSKRSIAIVVYVHMALFGATIISIFWSLVNERFDPHEAKRAVARIAAGGTLGGVLGGFIGWNIASLTSVRGMLAALAALNLIALVAVSRVSRSKSVAAEAEPAPSKPPGPDSTGTAVPGLPVERYLLTLGVMVAIVASLEAFADYAFAAQVRAHMHDGRQLMAFFSMFHMGIAVVTFLAQTLLSRPVLEKFGLAGTMTGLPVIVLILAGVVFQSPSLVTIVVLRGGEHVMSNSLWRSAYELLYTPVSRAKKRPMKTLIDVGCDRLGTLVASAAIMGMLAIAMPPGTLMIVIMLLAAAAIVCARVLQRGYIGALEESLRVGAVRIEHSDVIDATTRRTLRKSAYEPPRPAALAVTVPPPLSTLTGAPLFASIADLVSGEHLRVQRVLCVGEDDPRLTAFVVPLLQANDTRGEAIMWLRRLGPRIAGQLCDALADTSLHDDARRRIPRVLRAVPSRVAIEGLIVGLGDPRFEVRYECGIALARMVEQNSEVEVPHDQILGAVRRELAIERKLLDAETMLDPLDDEEDAPIFESVLRDRANRGLEHVFTILSLMLERDPLRTAFRAIISDDDALRGTALEYLENVLPGEIRDALWPYVTGKRGPDRESRRPAGEVLKELVEREGGVRGALQVLRSPRRGTA